MPFSLIKNALFTTYHRHWLDAGPFVDQRFAWVERLFTIGKPLTQIARIHHLPSFSRDCHGLPKSVLRRLQTWTFEWLSWLSTINVWPCADNTLKIIDFGISTHFAVGTAQNWSVGVSPYSSCRLICDLFYLSYLGILDPAWRTLPQTVCALRWSNWPHLLPGHRPHSIHCTPRVIISESEVDYLRKLNGNHETIPFKLST